MRVNVGALSACGGAGGLGTIWLAVLTLTGGMRPYRTLAALAVLALAAYLCQAGIGAMVVFSRADSLWAALHVGFAAATWAFLVALLVFETLNTAERFDGAW